MFKIFYTYYFIFKRYILGAEDRYQKLKVIQIASRRDGNIYYNNLKDKKLVKSDQLKDRITQEYRVFRNIFDGYYHRNRHRVEV